MTIAALTMDNMAGKEMAVLIIDPDDLHIHRFHISDCGLVPLYPDK